MLKRIIDVTGAVAGLLVLSPILVIVAICIRIQMGSANSVLVAREINDLGVKMLRIVDFLGDTASISHIGFELQRLMNDNQYEFLEFYCFGIGHEIMKKAGFTLTDENDVNVISLLLGAS